MSGNGVPLPIWPGDSRSRRGKHQRIARHSLRACLKSHVLAASRLVINWIMAIRIHVSVVSGKASKSLLNRRERLSQPATQDVEDSIHHLPHVGAARPTTSFCCRNERCQNTPLGIGQISRITCQDHRALDRNPRSARPKRDLQHLHPAPHHHSRSRRTGPALLDRIQREY